MNQAAAITLPELEKGRSLWQDALARFFRNRFAVLCAAVLLGIIALCYIGPHFVQDPDTQDLASRVTPPSMHYAKTPDSQDPAGGVTPSEKKKIHLLGTDDLGRDLFSRLLSGGQVSLNVAIIATFIAIVIGLLYGAVSGFLGGRADAVMMRIVDILMSLPFILFIILIKVMLDGQEWLNRFGVWLSELRYGPNSSERINVNMLVLYVAIGAVEWPTMARIVRSQVLSLRKMEFVEAATSLGLSQPAIILRHIIPNALGPAIVYATLIIPSVMLLEAALSYLGLGVQPPQASWGSLIEEGVKSMEVAPWLIWAPAGVFFLTLFCFNFVGDGLRDAFDVKAAKD